MPLLNFAVAFSIFDLRNNNKLPRDLGWWGLGYPQRTCPTSTLAVTQVGLGTTNTKTSHRIDMGLLL